MITITKVIKFSAAHRYWRDDWSKEENKKVFGDFADPYGHGHNYVLEVSLRGEVNSKTGMIIDLKDVKEILQKKVMELFDHKFINISVPYFQTHAPTTENLVLYIREMIKDAFLPAKVCRLRLWENEDLYAEWVED